ncbi:nucleotide-binding universal stress UspA family protein [Kitasatospora sp. MAP12-15]|uniref:universal stress protein n=1 Tax=Kitasatospora sp. MAP12-9 TaxID=3035100 RepID=UPI00247BE0A4|nr:nucleotide-binding universal stress UspA family protein [Kitasatospora sp. MAP12-44]
MYLPVVVGVDGSPDALAAAAWAAREAAARHRPLRIVHAVALMPHLLPSSPRPVAVVPGQAERAT